LFAIATEQWTLAAFVFFAVSLTSITALAVSVPLMLLESFVTGNILPFFVLLPGLLKATTHARFLIGDAGLKSGFTKILKHIGLVPVGVKYVRRSKRLNTRSTYFLAIYVLACAGFWQSQQIIPWLSIAAALLFLINQSLVRFADDQSVILLFSSVFASQVLAATPGITVLLLLIIVVNPLPRLLGVVDAATVGKNQSISIFSPFDHTRIERDCEALFQDVPECSRILFSFNDPCGEYENLFDGYRNAIEPLFYVAARRNIHLFPDWHTITETIETKEPNIWGRDLNSLKRNQAHWQADYVLYYRVSGESLPRDLSMHYQVIGSFDYADHLADIAQAEPWSGDLSSPKFLLLRSVNA
jgi:uncharacterized membrane protein